MSTLGKRLKAERKRLGYDLDEMAVAGGVRRSSQARYEADEGVPNADYLKQISAAGADVFWVLMDAREEDGMQDLDPINPPTDFEVDFLEALRAMRDAQAALLKRKDLQIARLTRQLCQCTAELKALK